MVKNIMFDAAKAVCGVVLSACLLASVIEPETQRMGLFSWKREVFQEGGTDLFTFMNKHGFTELYQFFSDDVGNRAIKKFLQNAKQAGIDIYLLAGEPSWANDSNGKAQRKAVEQASRINKLDKKAGLKGIVFDIEPYTLDTWDSKTAKIMERFLSGMTKAYDEAAAKQLEVILCIPFYYDNMGQKGYMEKLIQYGCDRVAIMNYFKKNEAENIEREVRYARRHQKNVIHIYEFKAPGTHGLREVNTYHGDGLEAARVSFEGITAAYPDAGIIMAAHDYEALQEVLE